MMPVKTFRILLPSRTEVTNITVTSKQEKLLNGKYYIFPVQHPLYGEQPKEFVEPKKDIYSLDKKYPANIIEFNYEGNFREYNIVEISVYPIQYLPIKKEISLNTVINFQIEYSSSTKYQSISRLRKNEKFIC